MRENIYCDGSVRIVTFLNKSRQESLLIEPVIIPTTLLRNLETLSLWLELLQKISP